MKEVKYPGYSRDIVSFGIVEDVAVANGAVSVSIHLTSAWSPSKSRTVQSTLKAIEGIRVAHVQIQQPEGQDALAGGQAPGRAQGAAEFPASK